MIIIAKQYSVNKQYSINYKYYKFYDDYIYLWYFNHFELIFIILHIS